MPELTPGLGLKKPLANEAVARESINDNWDIIDTSVATKTEIDNHIANINNPHNVTSALIGAVNNSEVDQASTANKIARRDSGGNVKAQQLISEAAQGAQPLVVASTTMVNNLNTHYVGGKGVNDLVQQNEIGSGPNQIPRCDSLGKLPVSVLPASQIVTGSYIGDGTSNKAITVGFRPKYILIFGMGYDYSIIDRTTSTAAHANAGEGYGWSQDYGRRITDTGFEVGKTTGVQFANNNGSEYTYVAFK